MSANSQTEDDEEIEENHNVEDMDVDPPIKQSQLQLHQTLEQITPKRSRRPHALQNHVLSEDDEEENLRRDEDDDEVEVMVDESKRASHAVQTPPSSPVKSLNSSASPVGVNRR